MSGRVTIVVLDNGNTSIQVPQFSTQLVIGCSSGGTANAPYASTSPTNIATQFGTGPLVEAAAMIAAVGGVPVCVKAATQTTGAKTAVVHAGTSTSVVTLNGTPLDTYELSVTVPAGGGGTIGTGPCAIIVSLDANRTQSPTIQLGTANTYAIPGTGLTLNFAAGNLVAGDTFQASTTEPLWNAAGIQAAINGFLASSYAKAGVGSIHIVGGSTAGGATGSDMVSIGGYLQTAKNNQYVFNRAYISARDAHPPATYGGTPETESAWMTAILTDFQGQSLNADTTGRTCVCASYWNMQSQITNSLGFAPRFRRSIAYAVAQRQVQIPPQRMPSRVKDGALSPIVISPADATDGFVYHDELVTPGLDTTIGGAGGWFAAATTIVGTSGVFVKHANLFSPNGSSYGYMPQGIVIDLACSIAYQNGVQNIDDDVRTVASGAIDPRDAAAIQNSMSAAIKNNMTSAGMLTASAANPNGCTVVVDQTANIGPGSQGNLPITVTVFQKSYILQETINVGVAAGP